MTTLFRFVLVQNTQSSCCLMTGPCCIWRTETAQGRDSCSWLRKHRRLLAFSRSWWLQIGKRIDLNIGTSNI